MRRAVDIALALALAVSGCLAGAFYHPAPWPAFDAVACAWTCAAALPLVARRDAPTVTLVLCTAGVTGYLALGYQPSLNSWIPAIALFNLAARRPWTRTAAGAGLTAAATAYSGCAARLHPVVIAVQALIVPVVAALLGRGQRLLADRNTELRRLTELLARRQETEAAQAVADERLRIARELHDAISQHMTVVTLQAGLAEYVFSTDPATAHTALRTVAGAGRQAMNELRRLLVVLRAHDAHTEIPPGELLPGIAWIPRMAQDMEASGLHVDTHIADLPPALHPGIEWCAFRIVQEALTNVIKHSAATSAQVSVTCAPGVLRISVVDDGGSRTDRKTVPPGSGAGLIGMRERVRIWNGSLTAGQRTQGGFAVRALIPLDS
ncbi:sensor histidine kinase [Streptomyces sp. NPDC047017]|uniref:sensor histidine kinase n=1 Tax=Streptomyces sp. NPDC047017 TaxID=3155024 RepID=UPI0033FA02FD